MSYAQVQPSSHPISILESEEYLLPVRWCTENLALQVSRSQHKDSLWAPSTAFQVLDTTIVASWLGESCPKKWKNMGKPGGKHGKNHGKSLFFTSEILGNNDVRESGPVPWDRPNAEKMIEKSFQDGKQKDMFLSFFRIASVLSIWIYLAIGFLWWHVYFLPAIPSPWSKLAHCTRKKTHLTAAVHHPKTQRPWISPAESKGLEIVDHCRPGKGHESTGSNWSCIPDPSFS